MLRKGNLAVFESSNISETGEATPIKIGVHELIGGGNMGAVGAVAPIVHLSEGQCPHGLCSVQQ